METDMEGRSLRLTKSPSLEAGLEIISQVGAVNFLHNIL